MLIPNLQIKSVSLRLETRLWVKNLTFVSVNLGTTWPRVVLTNPPKMTSSQLVGVLHRYCRDHGFESRQSLKGKDGPTKMTSSTCCGIIAELLRALLLYYRDPRAQIRRSPKSFLSGFSFAISACVNICDYHAYLHWLPRDTISIFITQFYTSKWHWWNHLKWPALPVIVLYLSWLQHCIDIVEVKVRITLKSE